MHLLRISSGHQRANVLLSIGCSTRIYYEWMHVCIYGFMMINVYLYLCNAFLLLGGSGIKFILFTGLWSWSATLAAPWSRRFPDPPTSFIRRNWAFHVLGSTVTASGIYSQKRSARLNHARLECAMDTGDAIKAALTTSWWKVHRGFQDSWAIQKRFIGLKASHITPSSWIPPFE
jgi:hypothetical protein